MKMECSKEYNSSDTLFLIFCCYFLGQKAGPHIDSCCTFKYKCNYSHHPAKAFQDTQNEECHDFVSWLWGSDGRYQLWALAFAPAKSKIGQLVHDNIRQWCDGKISCINVPEEAIAPPYGKSRSMRNQAQDFVRKAFNDAIHKVAQLQQDIENQMLLESAKILHKENEKTAQKKAQLLQNDKIRTESEDERTRATLLVELQRASQSSQNFEKDDIKLDDHYTWFREQALQQDPELAFFTACSAWKNAATWVANLLANTNGDKPRLHHVRAACAMLKVVHGRARWVNKASSRDTRESRISKLEATTNDSLKEFVSIVANDCVVPDTSDVSASAEEHRASAREGPHAVSTSTRARQEVAAGAWSVSQGSAHSLASDGPGTVPTPASEHVPHQSTSDGAAFPKLQECSTEDVIMLLRKRMTGMTESIATVLRDQEIDGEALSLFQSADFETCFPKLGPRRKLLNFFEAYKSESEQPVQSDPTPPSQTAVSSKSGDALPSESAQQFPRLPEQANGRLNRMRLETLGFHIGEPLVLRFLQAKWDSHRECNQGSILVFFDENGSEVSVFKCRNRNCHNQGHDAAATPPFSSLKYCCILQLVCDCVEYATKHGGPRWNVFKRLKNNILNSIPHWPESKCGEELLLDRMDTSDLNILCAVFFADPTLTLTSFGVEGQLIDELLYAARHKYSHIPAMSDAEYMGYFTTAKAACNKLAKMLEDCGDLSADMPLHSLDASSSLTNAKDVSDKIIEYQTSLGDVAVQGLVLEWARRKARNGLNSKRFVDSICELNHCAASLISSSCRLRDLLISKDNSKLLVLSPMSDSLFSEKKLLFAFLAGVNWGSIIDLSRSNEDCFFNLETVQRLTSNKCAYFTTKSRTEDIIKELSSMTSASVFVLGGNDMSNKASVDLFNYVFKLIGTFNGMSSQTRSAVYAVTNCARDGDDAAKGFHYDALQHVDADVMRCDPKLLGIYIENKDGSPQILLPSQNGEVPIPRTWWLSKGFGRDSGVELLELGCDSPDDLHHSDVSADVDRDILLKQAQDHMTSFVSLGNPAHWCLFRTEFDMQVVQRTQTDFIYDSVCNGNTIVKQSEFQGGTTIGRAVLHRIFRSRTHVCVCVRTLRKFHHSIRNDADPLGSLRQTLFDINDWTRLPMIVLVDLDREQLTSFDTLDRFFGLLSGDFVKLLFVIHETDLNSQKYESKCYSEINLDQLTEKEHNAIQKLMFKNLTARFHGCDLQINNYLLNDGPMAGFLDTARILQDREDERDGLSDQLVAMARSSPDALVQRGLFPLEIWELASGNDRVVDGLNEELFGASTSSYQWKSSIPLIHCGLLFSDSDKLYEKRIKRAIGAIIDHMDEAEQNFLKLLVFVSLFSPGFDSFVDGRVLYNPSTTDHGASFRIKALARARRRPDLSRSSPLSTIQEYALHLPRLAEFICEHPSIFNTAMCNANHGGLPIDILSAFVKPRGYLYDLVAADTGCTSILLSDASRNRDVMLPILCNAFVEFKSWHTDVFGKSPYGRSDTMSSTKGPRFSFLVDLLREETRIGFPERLDRAVDTAVILEDLALPYKSGCDRELPPTHDNRPFLRKCASLITHACRLYEEAAYIARKQAFHDLKKTRELYTKAHNILDKMNLEFFNSFSIGSFRRGMVFRRQLELNQMEFEMKLMDHKCPEFNRMHFEGTSYNNASNISEIHQEHFGAVANLFGCALQSFEKAWVITKFSNSHPFVAAAQTCVTLYDHMRWVFGSCDCSGSDSSQGGGRHSCVCDKVNVHNILLMFASEWPKHPLTSLIGTWDVNGCYDLLREANIARKYMRDDGDENDVHVFIHKVKKSLKCITGKTGPLFSTIPSDTIVVPPDGISESARSLICGIVRNANDLAAKSQENGGASASQVTGFCATPRKRAIRLEYILSKSTQLAAICRDHASGKTRSLHVQTTGNAMSFLHNDSGELKKELDRATLAVAQQNPEAHGLGRHISAILLQLDLALKCEDVESKSVAIQLLNEYSKKLRICSEQYKNTRKSNYFVANQCVIDKFALSRFIDVHACSEYKTLKDSLKRNPHSGRQFNNPHVFTTGPFADFLTAHGFRRFKGEMSVAFGQQKSKFISLACDDLPEIDLKFNHWSFQNLQKNTKVSFCIALSLKSGPWADFITLEHSLRF